MSWKDLSTKKLTTPTTSDNSLSPTIELHANSNFSLVFKGSCVKQKNATYTHPKRINLVIVYELDM